MKKLFILFLLFCAWPLAAKPALPDNIYFRAMQDEINRTQKELRVKGAAKPFFTAYEIFVTTGQNFSAMLGVPLPEIPHPGNLTKAAVYIYAGDSKNNSSGFKNDAYYYRPVSSTAIPVSYEGVRRTLWRLTDMEYQAASDSYEKKEAYKRQKNITEQWPDFSKSPHASYVQEITPFPALDNERLQQMVNETSAQGKKLPYLESFQTSLNFTQKDIYFLDSEGDFYQYVSPTAVFGLSAVFRTKEGYQRGVSRSFSLEFGQLPDEAFLQEKTQEFLTRIEEMYNAQKIESYLGPVLLEPKAAAGFFNDLFVRNANHSKALLSAQSETDGSVGQFKDKIGMRVMSHLFDVYDRPQEQTYLDKPLKGFMPIDDEGVRAQTLHLVHNGKLQALPTVRSLIKDQKQSNGHARMSGATYPRAALTNVFFVPHQTLTPQELEQKLLERCRELDLEYGYILPQFPALSDGKGELNFAWRIYTKDGRKEPVYGLRLEGVTTRSLRDILAAGNDEEVSSYTDPIEMISSSLVAPSLLVDEIEISPSQRKPDRKPFVPLP